MSYKHIFGPINSRRFGCSLGIDLVPHKVCTLNCIYCECGKTTNLTLEKKEWINTDEVIQELQEFRKENILPDVITFSGAGEPTLHSKLDFIAKESKLIFTGVKTLLLTNGTILNNELLCSLKNIDIIKISVDAITEKSFQSINKPHSNISLHKMLQNIKQFTDKFSGEILYEFFLIDGINSSNDELNSIATYFKCLKGNTIHINTLDRPPAFEGVTKPSRETILEAKKVFEEITDKKIIVTERNNSNTTNNLELSESNLLNAISRRPLDINDLLFLFNSNLTELEYELNRCLEQNKIAKSTCNGITFYNKK